MGLDAGGRDSGPKSAIKWLCSLKPFNPTTKKDGSRTKPVLTRVHGIHLGRMDSRRPSQLGVGGGWGWGGCPAALGIDSSLGLPSRAQPPFLSDL